MNTILITGAKQVGKNTVSKLLSDHLSYVELSLAEPIKQLALLLHPTWNYDMYMDGCFKELVDPHYGYSPRQFLQTYGTDFAQHFMSDKFPKYKEAIGRTFWCDYLYQKYHRTYKNIIISDCRFKHEYEYFNKIGKCTVIQIIRATGLNDTHESEQGWIDIDYSYYICNNSSVDDLKEQVLYIANEMQVNKNI